MKEIQLRDARAGDVVRLGHGTAPIRSVDDNLIILVNNGKTAVVTRGFLEAFGVKAFRELPDVPQGLGAIVRTDDGKIHVRADKIDLPWLCIQPPEWGWESDGWLAMQGFEVLREGIEVPADKPPGGGGGGDPR